MWLCDKTEVGFAFGYAKGPVYIILAISPIMEKGFVDYAFKVAPLRLRICRGRLLESMGSLTMPKFRTKTDGIDMWAESY